MRYQVLNILVSTVKYPTRTSRSDQNEVPWNELTDDTDPEGSQTILKQYPGIPSYPNPVTYFSRPIGN